MTSGVGRGGRRRSPGPLAAMGLRSGDVAHPQMFDEDDPVLARVRDLALALPDSAEKVSHGRPAFFTRKVFAYYGGSVRDGDVWTEHAHSLLVQPDPEDRPALLGDRRAFVPAYLGPTGWVGVDLDESTDWTEVAELLDASYRLTAPKRSVARLDLDVERTADRAPVPPRRPQAGGPA